MENGPWRVDGNGGLKTVEGGWEEYTTMVYGSAHSSIFNPLFMLAFPQWTSQQAQASRIPALIITFIPSKRSLYHLFFHHYFNKVSGFWTLDTISS